jgi:hypothetical protein
MENKMSLLPIIYTSLMLFTAVMTIILIVSYISYKAKQRNTLPDNSIYEDTMNSNAALLINQTHFAPSLKPVPVYSQPTRATYNNQRRTTYMENTSERHNQRRTTGDSNPKKRFQVMNNVARNEFIPDLQPSSSLGGFNRTPAAEFNFLSYYSDQRDDKLNRIPVDRYSTYR